MRMIGSYGLTQTFLVNHIIFMIIDSIVVLLFRARQDILLRLFIDKFIRENFLDVLCRRWYCYVISAKRLIMLGYIVLKTNFTFSRKGLSNQVVLEILLTNVKNLKILKFPLENNFN